MGNIEGMGHSFFSVDNILATFDNFNTPDGDGWGVPEGFLVFGFAPGAPGEAFAFSYKSDIFPLYSIVWMNLEAHLNEPEYFVKIADSFDEFADSIRTREEYAEITGDYE